MPVKYIYIITSESCL